jgi:hypothetical protein
VNLYHLRGIRAGEAEVVVNGERPTITLDLADLRQMLIEWHVDEVTDEAEAADYADRFIERAVHEARADR